MLSYAVLLIFSARCRYNILTETMNSLSNLLLGMLSVLKTNQQKFFLGNDADQYTICDHLFIVYEFNILISINRVFSLFKLHCFAGEVSSALSNNMKETLN